MTETCDSVIYVLSVEFIHYLVAFELLLSLFRKVSKQTPLNSNPNPNMKNKPNGCCIKPALTSQTSAATAAVPTPETPRASEASDIPSTGDEAPAFKADRKFLSALTPILVLAARVSLDGTSGAVALPVGI